ncbi:MAG: hypothetical protein RLZZ380_1075 [Actinomycetota bacterium]
MPALLIVEAFPSPRISQLNPVIHFLDILAFLFLFHVSSLSSLLDLSEAKIININKASLTF